MRMTLDYITHQVLTDGLVMCILRSVIHREKFVQINHTSQAPVLANYGGGDNDDDGYAARYFDAVCNPKPDRLLPFGDRTAICRFYP